MSTVGKGMRYQLIMVNSNCLKPGKICLLMKMSLLLLYNITDLTCFDLDIPILYYLYICKN